MKDTKRPRGSKERRRLRERPTPKWLDSQDLDEMAKRRCLMILSVLSGATPVSQAIAESKISRGTYYQLETRALKAMLQALVPGAEMTGGGEGVTQRLSEMEKKLQRAEKDRRRAERLLYLTRQVVKPGALVTDKGPRRPRKRSSSMSAGKGPSKGSTKARSSKIPSPPLLQSPSTPQAVGTDGR